MDLELPDSGLSELQFLRKYPHFKERPATVEQFLGPDYLNIDKQVRPGIRDLLVDIFGTEVQTENPLLEQQSLFVGAIGIGKTTAATAATAYVVHWLLCLRDPQEYLGMIAGSQIVIAMIATKEQQARDVTFAAFKKLVEFSPWFAAQWRDPNFKNQMRFSSDLWVYPLSSAPTAAEGLNVFFAVMDEIDSMLRNDQTCAATKAYNAIFLRIASRFNEKGGICLIGQLKSDTGFAQEKWDDFGQLGYYRNSMTIWESRGWDFYEDDEGNIQVFYYDTDRQDVVPDFAVETGTIDVDSDKILKIPAMYKAQFLTDPPTALRDLAGIPPRSGSHFIALRYKIDPCRERWEMRYDIDEGPVDLDGQIRPWFKAPDRLERVIHIDVGLGGNGDALGLAMGHVAGFEQNMVSGESKPVIVFDLLKQWATKPGVQIQFYEVRQFIYDLIDQFGFNVKMVTMDGFQSTDSLQQLRRRRIVAKHLSVDKTKAPYYDLREAIYEERVEWPRLQAVSRKDNSTILEIPSVELTQLVEDERRIDHPPNGTKDVTDAMAGVVYSLMGDRRYRRTTRVDPNYNPQMASRSISQSHHAYRGDVELKAPIPGRIEWQ